MARAAVFSDGRFSRRKIIAGLAVGLLACGLWLMTRDGALVATFVLLATAALVLFFLVAQRRRRSVAQARAGEQRAHQEYIDNIAAHLDLDRRLAAIPALAGERPGTPAPRIARTPMSTGKSSHFLNRVQLTRPNGSRIELVEKGVDGDSDELRFWRDERRSELILKTERYETLEPIAVVPDDVVSVMYFPYLSGLDRDRKALRHHFRANVAPIVSAVANFNGRNLVEPHSRWYDDPLRFVPDRPTVARLERRLNVSKEIASDLVKSWDEVLASWDPIGDAYERLPRCLCHNDVSPWNAVHIGGVTRLSDFGLAGAGPVGSDLHTIIRWSGKAIEDKAHVERLLNTYLAAVPPFGGSVSLADVRLAAWTAFFLRYTNLKYSSARHLHSYRLALHRMNELICSYT